MSSLNTSEIVVWQTAHLGDAVLATGLIQSWLDAFPKSRVHFVVRRGLGDLFKSLSRVQVHEDDKTFESAWRLTQKLRHLPTVFLQRSERTLMISAFFSNKTGFQILGKHRVSRPGRSSEHEIEKNLRAGQKLCQLLGESPQLKIMPPRLVSMQVNQDCDFVLVPSSTWATKRWTYFPQLAVWLAEQGFKLKIIGEQDHHRYAHDNILDFRGKLPLEQLIAHIDSGRAMICNDSGPMHIARAMDKPVFAFFGPTVREFGYFPVGYDRTKVQVLEMENLECRPCRVHGSKSCPLDHHKCMQEMTLEKVIPAFSEWNQVIQA